MNHQKKICLACMSLAILGTVLQAAADSKNKAITSMYCESGIVLLNGCVSPVWFPRMAKVRNIAVDGVIGHRRVITQFDLKNFYITPKYISLIVGSGVEAWECDYEGRIKHPTECHDLYRGQQEHMVSNVIMLAHFKGDLLQDFVRMLPCNERIVMIRSGSDSLFDGKGILLSELRYALFLSSRRRLYFVFRTTDEVQSGFAIFELDKDGKFQEVLTCPGANVYVCYDNKQELISKRDDGCTHSVYFKVRGMSRGEGRESELTISVCYGPNGTLCFSTVVFSKEVTSFLSKYFY